MIWGIKKETIIYQITFSYSVHYSSQADISREDFCLKKKEKKKHSIWHNSSPKSSWVIGAGQCWFCHIGVDQMGGFRCGLSKSESKALWSCTATPDLQRSRSSTRGRFEHYHFPDRARWRLSDTIKNKIKELDLTWDFGSLVVENMSLGLSAGCRDLESVRVDIK